VGNFPAYYAHGRLFGARGLWATAQTKQKSIGVCAYLLKYFVCPDETGPRVAARNGQIKTPTFGALVVTEYLSVYSLATTALASNLGVFSLGPLIRRGLNDRDQGEPLLWGRPERAARVAKVAPLVERLPGKRGSEGNNALKEPSFCAWMARFRSPKGRGIR